MVWESGSWLYNDSDFLVCFFFRNIQILSNHKLIHESQSLFTTRKKGEFAMKIILCE